MFAAMAWVSALGLRLAPLAPIGAVLGFFFGLWKYSKAQTWKRSEWVAQEMRSFFSDDYVRCALIMIDWGRPRTLAFPRADGAEGTHAIQVDDAVVAKALRIHTEGGPFTPDEAIIRDTFDHFLFGLERGAANAEDPARSTYIP